MYVYDIVSHNGLPKQESIRLHILRPNMPPSYSRMTMVLNKVWFPHVHPPMISHLSNQRYFLSHQAFFVPLSLTATSLNFTPLTSVLSLSILYSLCKHTVAMTHIILPPNSLKNSSYKYNGQSTEQVTSLSSSSWVRNTISVPLRYSTIPLITQHSHVSAQCGVTTTYPYIYIYMYNYYSYAYYYIHWWRS